jgi:hypothetical protein
LERLNNLEPARVRAVWASIVALLVSLGITVNSDVDGFVQAAIVLVFTLLPLLQGELTRAKVTPVFKVEEAEKLADMEAEMDRLKAEENADNEDVSSEFIEGGE